MSKTAHRICREEGEGEGGGEGQLKLWHLSHPLRPVYLHGKMNICARGEGPYSSNVRTQDGEIRAEEEGILCLLIEKTDKMSFRSDAIYCAVAEMSHEFVYISLSLTHTRTLALSLSRSFSLSRTQAHVRALSLCDLQRCGHAFA